MACISLRKRPCMSSVGVCVEAKVYRCLPHFFLCVFVTISLWPGPSQGFQATLARNLRDASSSAFPEVGLKLVPQCLTFVLC